MRLDALCTILPGLKTRLPIIHPHLLAAVLADPPLCADRVVAIRNLFPSANLDQLLSNAPALLLREAKQLA